MNKKFKERQEARDLRKQGLSLIKISKILGVSKSSVSKWVSDILLNSHQLELLGRIESSLSTEEGKNRLNKYLLQFLSTRSIANLEECSNATIRYWIKKHGLFITPRKNRTSHHCVCGETNPKKFYGRKKGQCAACDIKYQIERNRRRKQMARDFLGGQCSYCGFSKWQVALDIHHTDPSKKDPNFSGMSAWSWKRIIKEIESCILLCKNCHSAFHNGDIELGSVSSVESERLTTNQQVAGSSPARTIRQEI